MKHRCGPLRPEHLELIWAEVERWRWWCLSHLYRDDDLDECMQCIRIDAWLGAVSLARRGKWHRGLVISTVYYARRNGWRRYRAERRDIGICAGRCRRYPVASDGEVLV
jgi:hypothetical protein